MIYKHASNTFSDILINPLDYLVIMTVQAAKTYTCMYQRAQVVPLAKLTITLPVYSVDSP